MLTIWKSLIRSRGEYASILWSPSDATNIRNLENTQRRFTSKFAEFRKYNDTTGHTECIVDYWDRLKKLKLNSLQRRRDRYMICYMYKIHIGMVPDLGFLSDIDRNGVKYFAKHSHQAAAAVQSLRTSSFFSKGPLLFDLLPQKLRAPARPPTPEEAKKLKDRFKKHLDKWLELIPDQPTTPGINCDSRCADSNKLVDQYRAHSTEIKRKWKEIEQQLDDEERNSGQNNDGTAN